MFDLQRLNKSVQKWKKSLYFKGKILNFFFKKQKESISWNELILTLKKREIELEKHFSNRSKHFLFGRCKIAAPQYSNRFIIKSLKSEGLIFSVKRYELLHKSPVIELTFLQIDFTWSSNLSWLSIIKPSNLKFFTNVIFYP